MSAIAWAQGLREFVDALMRTPYLRSLEARIEQQRMDFMERLRDKDAVIQDLRVRLAIAETDALREKLPKVPAPSKPVPEFGGPLPFQDELARMKLEREESNDAV